MGKMIIITKPHRGAVSVCYYHSEEELLHAYKSGWWAPLTCEHEIIDNPTAQQALEDIAHDLSWMRVIEGPEDIEPTDDDMLRCLASILWGEG